MIRLKFFMLVVVVSITHSLPVYAHPEFQTFTSKYSGRTVDCGFCHIHPEGPEGTKPGQIGSLDAEQMARLGHARAAFEPHANAENPLLNTFGNHMLNTIGKQQILFLRQQPDKLPQMLGYISDLDGDGISDADEYLSGTHPLNPHHGDPWQLFVHNFKTHKFDILMIAIATGLGLFGLNHLRQWFNQIAPSSDNPHSK